MYTFFFTLSLSLWSLKYDFGSLFCVLVLLHQSFVKLILILFKKIVICLSSFPHISFVSFHCLILCWKYIAIMCFGFDSVCEVLIVSWCFLFALIIKINLFIYLFFQIWRCAIFLYILLLCLFRKLNKNNTVIFSYFSFDSWNGNIHVFINVRNPLKLCCFGHDIN